MKKLMLALIRFYQVSVSPLLRPCCRFQPSCSRYAAEAVEKHGACKGFLLAAWRILRCNPFCEGGYDPVPEKFPARRSDSTLSGNGSSD